MHTHTLSLNLFVKHTYLHTISHSLYLTLGWLFLSSSLHVTMYTKAVGGQSSSSLLQLVWPDWAIYWTLGNFSKHLATIILPKLLTFYGNFCKGVNSFHFSCFIIFGQLFVIIWRLFSGHTGCSYERFRSHWNNIFVFKISFDLNGQWLWLSW